MGRQLQMAGLLLAASLWAGGCATKTETGYEPPHRLGMTDAQLRALYAPDFTPEANGGSDKNGPGVNPDFRRPGIGMGY